MKNVCIVGYGAIGPVHAKALEMVENAKLYAVCEIDGEKRKKCRSTYDGYFVAYIPEGWDDIIFNTTGYDIAIAGMDYGHLTLSFEIGG